MTQLEAAKNNTLTSLMKRIASDESIKPDFVLKMIKEGKIVIPANNSRSIKNPCAVGKGLRTKINANIGTSPDKSQITKEIEKLKTAIKCGADTIMDLSVGKNILKTRKEILKYCTIPLGTVPIYEIAVNAQNKHKSFLNFNATEALEILENQAKEGVDFFTIHAGVTRKSVHVLKEQKRIMGIVSRGGAMLAAWMKHNKKENPFYEYFDEVLNIAYKYDVTLSLGDGLRPGSILDATDKAQITELKILGELTLRAREKNVQVIIEGPGHVPLNQIKKNIELQKKFCHDAPFYVLGPLVTDVAPGYDHITSAIGGALAASYGADFLCYVTPAEHLRHPTIEDVKEGVIAARIAAHAADIVKYDSAKNWDKKMSEARKRRDWQEQIRLSVDPQKAKEYRASSKPQKQDVCTMCGDYCSIKVSEDAACGTK